jgi:hypothetical protein
MPYVNLWELITTVSSKSRDLPNREACEEIKQACAERHCFASELSLEVENGVWIVKLFDHEDSNQHVTLKVFPNGNVVVARGRTDGDVYDERKVTF